MIGVPVSLLKPRVMTPALLAANRANALKSTGPKTPAGKAASRLNALKQGRRSQWLGPSALRQHPRSCTTGIIPSGGQVRDCLEAGAASREEMAQNIARAVWRSLTEDGARDPGGADSERAPVGARGRGEREGPTGG